LDAERLLRELQKPKHSGVLEKTYWLCIFAVNEHKSICGTCWNCNPCTPEDLAAPTCQCNKACTCGHKDICGRCWATDASQGKPKFNPCDCGSTKWSVGDPDYEIDKFSDVVAEMDGLVVSLDPDLGYSLVVNK
jgi:hypothetical protein